MADPVEVPEVLVEADDLPLPLPAPPGAPPARDVDPNDLSLEVGGRIWRGWDEITVGRGCERLPSSFSVKLTERFPGEAAALIIEPGADCLVRLGRDKVITGAIDRYLPNLDAKSHTVSIQGRSNCRELVDCAAVVPGWQISGKTVKGVIETLAAFYGVGVSAPQGDGPLIPQINVIPGETVYEVVARLALAAKFLAYDDPDGNLVLSGVGTERHASGLKEGENAKVIGAAFSADQRYSEYWVYDQTVSSLLQIDAAAGGTGMPAPLGLAKDEGVKRKRIHITMLEHSGPGDTKKMAQDRAEWEAGRQRGRAEALRVRVDSWRDKAGELWQPNKLVKVSAPTCHVSDAEWIIGDVTYRRGERGTSADLVVMPPIAFAPQYVPYLPFNPQLADAARVGAETEQRRSETLQ